MIGSLLSVAGIENSVQGVSILVDSTRYIITQDCLGWKSMAAFTGLMYASDSIRDNLEVLFTGILLVEAANIVRVFTTVYLAHQGIIPFEVIHGFLWKWGLTALVLLIWYLWFTERDSRLDPAVSKLRSELEEHKD